MKKILDIKPEIANGTGGMKWPEVQLQDVLTLEYGRALREDTRDSSGDIPVAGSNGIVGRHSESLVDGPGIVVGRKGSAGKVTWFSNNFWPIDTTYYVKPKAVCSFRWVYYLLNCLQLDRLSTVTGVPGLNRNDAYKQKFALPPISEQRRIVEILDQADALRKKRAEANAKAARILPALFYKMFGDPATKPKGLDKKKLGELIKVRSGNFLPAKNMDPEGQYPVYGGNGINGYHSEYMFEQPVIVLGRVGAYCGTIYYSEPNCWVTDNALYVAEQSDDLHPRYLTEALRVANLNQYAGRAGQPLISGSRIYPVEILVPPPEDQETFAISIVNLHRDENRRKDADDHIQKLFFVLLHRAFTGDLTAKWRETHMKELLAEMEQQGKLLALENIE